MGRKPPSEVTLSVIGIRTPSGPYESVPQTTCLSVQPIDLGYIKYSLDFLRPITTAEAFEGVDWIPQQTWPQAGRSRDVIFLKSTAAILAAAMFVGDRTTASTSLAGAAAVVQPSLHSSQWYPTYRSHRPHPNESWNTSNFVVAIYGRIPQLTAPTFNSVFMLVSLQFVELDTEAKLRVLN